MAQIRSTTKLSPRKNAPGVYDVFGRHGDYVTIIRDSNRTCTCPDFIYHRYLGQTCKHIDAALRLAQAELEAQEIVNTSKPVERVSILPPVEPEPLEHVGFHYRLGKLYYNDTPIETAEDYQKIKSRTEVE